MEDIRTLNDLFYNLIFSMISNKLSFNIFFLSLKPLKSFISLIKKSNKNKNYK